MAKTERLHRASLLSALSQNGFSLFLRSTSNKKIKAKRHDVPPQHNHGVLSSVLGKGSGIRLLRLNV